MANLLAYLTVVGVASTSYLNLSLSWIALLIGTIVLSLVQVLEQRRYRARLAEVGMVDLLQAAAIAGVGNGFIAALAACLLGIGTRLVFG